jgi:hypothetical protein
MNNHKVKIEKPICSISAMAKTLNLSRSRLYQLQKQGIMPLAIYDIRTKRAFFDQRLQQLCLQIRETGIGANGSYILFYSVRHTHPDDVQKVNKRGSKPKSNPCSEYDDIVQTLKDMGMNVSASDVEEAIRNLYPDGIDGKDQGIVIREIYRTVKGRQVK